MNSCQPLQTDLWHSESSGETAGPREASNVEDLLGSHSSVEEVVTDYLPVWVIIKGDIKKYYDKIFFFKK